MQQWWLNSSAYDTDALRSVRGRTTLMASDVTQHIHCSRTSRLHMVYDSHIFAYFSGKGTRRFIVRAYHVGLTAGAFAKTKRAASFRAKAARKSAAKAEKARASARHQALRRTRKRGRQKREAPRLTLSTLTLARSRGLRQREAELRKRAVERAVDVTAAS